MKLLIATQNKGKQAELRHLLNDLPLTLYTPDEVGLGTFDVEETGTTFRENAALKALAFAKVSGIHVLADDSGLSVDALNGAPGVYTARYGGPGLAMMERRQKLLDALRDVPMEKRTARFECVIVVADPNTLDCTYVPGVCSGQIAMQESGEGGFGYDPVFIPDGFECTFAEIDETTKNQISHRGRAIQQILPYLLLMATDDKRL